MLKTKLLMFIQNLRHCTSEMCVCEKKTDFMKLVINFK